MRRLSLIAVFLLCVITLACEGRRSWFFWQRYDPSVPIFWTKKNKEVPPEVFDWWSTTQQESSLFHALMLSHLSTPEQLIDLGLTPYPENASFYLPNGIKEPSCAVVGSGRNLLGANYGAEIDAHDVVIRVNRAITKGYEADVGTRTTHHLLYVGSEGWKVINPASQLIILHQRATDLMFFSNKHGVDPLFREMCKKGMALLFHPRFEWYCAKKWVGNEGHNWPSTGMYGIILALHHCKTVDVYGFGANKNGCWDRYFDDDLRCQDGKGHLMGKEIALRKKMEEEKLITVHPGIMK